jgi:hypothetical protein
MHPGVLRGVVFVVACSCGGAIDGGTYDLRLMVPGGGVVRAYVDGDTEPLLVNGRAS